MVQRALLAPMARKVQWGRKDLTAPQASRGLPAYPVPMARMAHRAAPDPPDPPDLRGRPDPRVLRASHRQEP